MYCKNMSKALNGKIKCKKHKRYITMHIDCENCSDFILVRNKGIRKTSSKKIKVTDDTYNKVMQRDKYKCRLCGTIKELQLHHIMGRGKDLTNNIDNCIMLCRNCHLEVVHKNQKKYRPILKEMIKNDIKI